MRRVRALDVVRDELLVLDFLLHHLWIKNGAEDVSETDFKGSGCYPRGLRMYPQGAQDVTPEGSECK